MNIIQWDSRKLFGCGGVKEQARNPGPRRILRNLKIEIVFEIEIENVPWVGGNAPRFVRKILEKMKIYRIMVRSADFEDNFLTEI